MAKLATPLLEFAEIIKEKGLVANRALNASNKLVKRFIRLAKKVPDIRLKGMIDYPLAEILLVAFFAVLSGAETFTQMSKFGKVRAEWFKGFLKFKNGTPSHDTFRRVFSLIDPNALQSLTVDFLMENMQRIKAALNISPSGPRLINIDGKQARGTGRSRGKNGSIPNLQTLNVYDASSSICIAMKCIDQKSNEIPAAQEVLPFLDIKGAIVTCDALNTQKNTIAIIASKEKKGEYVAALKGNQHLFFKEVVSYFSEEKLKEISEKGVNFFSTTEKAHSQLEQRNYYLTAHVKWFAELGKWEKLRAFICFEKIITDVYTGEVKTEKRYFIASITDVELCAEAIRGHWSVENLLHWHLDYSFGDDYDTNTFKNAYLNFTLFRRMALTLCKIAQPFMKDSIKTMRWSIGLDPISQLGMILGTLDEDHLEEALRAANQKTE
jgi:predicted transposase YbfD/YdcC